MDTSKSIVKHKKLFSTMGTKDPSKCKVIMLNDNQTTQEFVVTMLIKVFGMEHNTAYNVMMKIHTSGRAIVYESSYDDCYSKVCEVEGIARGNGFPLKVIIEE